MKLQVLGSGTTSWDTGRACASYLLQHEEARLLLDCGPGSLYQLQHFGHDYLDLDAVFLSHYEHVDHAGDIAALFFALNYTTRDGERCRRTRPLELWGPAGTKEFTDRLLAAFPKASPQDYELVTREMDAEESNWKGLRLRTEIMAHGEAEARGLRIEANGASLAYSGDTGPCDGLRNLCRGVNLALVECSYLAGEMSLPTHLSAREVGEIANDVGVQSLLLTHRYTIGTDREVHDQVRASFGGPLEFARDGDVHEIARTA